jgi:multiple sugar transport system substrate-binding protein
VSSIASTIRKRGCIRSASLVFLILLLLLLNIAATLFSLNPNILSFAQEENKQIILNAMLDNLGQIEKKERWQLFFNDALNELETRHPSFEIEMNYTELPGNESRSRILSALENKSSVDIISVDQIWLGEFAEKGLLTDLSNYTQRWGRASDWYEVNWDGGAYNDKIYGIWAWTDVRGIWYWKDLLHQTGINPDSLKTWDGYIAAAKKINNTLNGKIIQSVHLSGVDTAVDLWYPYLWMLGGAIVESRPGHPTKDFYWYPSYNSSEGVRALEFIKNQIEAGVKPQTKFFDTAFAKNKSFAVMLAGSWMPGEFPRQEWADLEEKLGFIPMFPVPSAVNDTATTMGGWMLSIPQSSKNKDLAWELITIALQPDRLTPWLERYGYLPTQIPIGERVMQANNLTSFPYYPEMVSMIPYGHNRPAIPEYPQIASHIKQALDNVYYGLKDPQQALDEAAAKSVRVLGW